MYLIHSSNMILGDNHVRQGLHITYSVCNPANVIGRLAAAKGTSLLPPLTSLGAPFVHSLHSDT